MSNGLRVLAHVEKLPQETIKALAGTEPKVPGFPEWLDIGHPRHAFLTDEIRGAATEFAVADATTIHRTFKTQAEAEAARDSAKITFGVDMVELPAEKAEEPAPAPEKAAPAE